MENHETQTTPIAGGPSSNDVLGAAECKADPKLKRTSVTARYSADDGYRSETTFTTNGHPHPIPPEIPLLEALEELARLTALFGFEDEALTRFNRVRQRVFDWRKTQAPNA